MTTVVGFCKACQADVHVPGKDVRWEVAPEGCIITFVCTACHALQRQAHDDIALDMLSTHGVPRMRPEEPVYIDVTCTMFSLMLTDDIIHRELMSHG